jgi:hypothetical protein
MIEDSIVEAAALNVPTGPFGTCFNGQTFQQEAVLTLNGYQYAAYYADGGVLCLARRKLAGGRWQSLRFEDYRVTHDDVHNVAALGICPGDGTIHLAYDHHVSTLHYRKSTAGLALHPEANDWSTGAFGETTSRLAGETLHRLTYPQFFGTPRGDLQLIYRLGTSGDGDWYLAEYSAASGEWSILGTLFTRHGTYKTSLSRCAYPNPVRYGPGNRLHVTWCWRERPANGIRDLRTNHDLCYTWSDDYGRTWQNNDGRLAAMLGAGQTGVSASLGIDTPGTVARRTRYLWGQMNTTTQYVDAVGRVHVINWQHQQDADAGSTDLNTWRYTHYWRDTNGAWHTNKLPFWGRKPQIVVDARGRAYVLYGESDDRNYHHIDPGWRLVLVAASPESDWKDWRRLWTSSRTFVGEPLLDPVRWQQEGILSVYAQEQPESAGEASPLHVFDVDVSKMTDT